MSEEIDNNTKLSMMLKGFSPSRYGNNWMVLSTKTDSYNWCSICGVLKSPPSLSFSRDLVEGPMTLPQDILTTITNSDIFSTLGVLGGASLNLALASKTCSKVPGAATFQKNGFTFDLEVWNDPRDLYPTDCRPSSILEVVSYLYSFAVVKTYEDLEEFTREILSRLNRVGEGLVTGIASTAETIADVAKNIMKSDDEADEGSESSTVDNLKENINKISNSILTNAIVSDSRRFAEGPTLYNENIHRLDILRCGVLDKYIPVVITDWRVSRDYDSYGEKCVVSISCKPDQRMSSSRLKLFCE